MSVGSYVVSSVAIMSAKPRSALLGVPSAAVRSGTP